jgi:hypothetical protein
MSGQILACKWPTALFRHATKETGNMYGCKYTTEPRQ